MGWLQFFGVADNSYQIFLSGSSVRFLEIFFSWKCSYQRADPNFVMLTPNKEHLAEGIHWKLGKRPLLQSDVNSGNFDGVPRELRPLYKVL